MPRRPRCSTRDYRTKTSMRNDGRRSIKRKLAGAHEALNPMPVQRLAAARAALLGSFLVGYTRCVGGQFSPSWEKQDHTQRPFTFKPSENNDAPSTCSVDP
ncbi:hypothetical protein VTN96DRAFT_8130 [Rasamsonia emersonii]